MSRQYPVVPEFGRLSGQTTRRLVRMKANRKDNYHHGNLRQALLDTAMEALTSEGMDKLSLRGLAKTLGVTPTAVYGHFADKVGLMVELRTQGFVQFRECMYAALDNLPAGTPAEDKVRALGHAYMHFALNHSHLFDAMFFWTPDLERITPECIQQGAGSEQLLRATLIEMLRENGREVDASCAAVASFSAWALVHGLSTLLRTGSIEGAVHCESWPEEFSAQHPQSRQADVIEQLLTIQIEGLKASVGRQVPAN